MGDGKKHAKYSASGSERWIKCPGSIQLSERAPPPRESEWSIEGTTAHTVLETLLKNPHKRMQLAAELSKKHGAQMISHVESAVTEVYKLKPKDAELLVEVKSNLDFIEPNMGGTTDVALVEEFGTLTIIDFKYGAGIPVDVEGNTQLISYALGIAHEYNYNFEQVKLVIIQPRAPHEGGQVRSWSLPIKELKDYSKVFYQAVQLSKQKNPPLVAGDHCRFCPASVLCPEISNKALATAKIDFAPVTGEVKTLKPQGLTPSQIGVALSAFKQIEFWIEEVREHALDQMKRGLKVPGWKVVGKRGTRKWAKPDAVAKSAKKLWGAKAFTQPELLSPAQLEELGPKAKSFVEKFSTNVSSGVTLAPDTDKRQAVNQLELDFGSPISKEKTK